MTLLASTPEFSSPALSACSTSSRKRRRACSEEAFFLAQDQEVQAAKVEIDTTIAPDIKRRVRRSLDETLVELHDEYPEEMSAKDFVGARRRAASELSELAERLSTPGASAFASPALPPLSELPPAIEEVGALPLAEFEFVEHDGLLDHEQLMQAIYLSQGLDFAAVQGQANNFLREIGMRTHDLGVKNTDENGRVMVNQCFYLSIAHAYLGHEATAQEYSALALRLKRAIEAAVLAANPSLATAKADDVDAMAFADFLPIAMRVGSSEQNGDSSQNAHRGADESTAEPNLTAELAVCILDSIQGHVEVFLGPRYSLQNDNAKERNLILLWYTPGHYQCIVQDDVAGSKVSISYDKFKDLLMKHGVMYIETTE